MLINGSKIEWLVRDFRMSWIRGSRGSGKTSLAYFLAEQWLKRGYRLVSNNQCVWNDDMNKIKPDAKGQLHVVVVADEGGKYLANSYQLEEVDQDLRKMDVIFLVPSYRPPSRAAQALCIQKLINLRQTGLPIIVYRWDVRDGSYRDHGIFIWFNPVFGQYSTLDPGDDLSQIVGWLKTSNETLRKIYNRRPVELPTLAVQNARLVDSLDGLAETMEQNALSIPQRGKRTRF